MRLQRPFLHPSNTKHISPGFWSCNAKAHRTAEETETAKLLIVLDRGLRREAFHHRKGLGRRGAQGIDGYKWTSTKGPCGGFGGRKYRFPDPEKKRQLNRQQMEKLSQRFSRLTGSFLLAPFSFGNLGGLEPTFPATSGTLLFGQYRGQSQNALSR